MLSLQQQNNNQSSVNGMMPQMNLQSQQQENQHDRAPVNSQQGLADKIQAVRHLWEAENQYPNSSPFTHQLPTSPIVDPTLYNQMNTTFQQATQGFIPFQ